LEAAPVVYVSDTSLLESLKGQNMADICITSQLEIIADTAPSEAFSLDDVAGVGVVPSLAEGRKCQRSWKVLPDVGTVGDYPDLSPRDAAAVAEFDASA
ncbi:MAG: isoleucine--tRNA ligase, partial [Pseudomonadota bacterium]|nr:isoleucine--tRNA ligase [Pseudomonadota bacterium]